jgi:lipoprotein NlpD
MSGCGAGSVPRPARGCATLGCAVSIVLLLAGCGGRGVAPVVDKELRAGALPGVTQRPRQTVPATASEPVPPAYLVVAGDTLYAIAWRYRLDYREVARWNGISEPYLIHPGQHLRLRPSTGDKGPGTAASAQPDPQPRVATRPPVIESASATPRSKALPKPLSPSANLIWHWPAKGVVRDADSPLGKKGVEILGARGQPVYAAADGEVVYSGSGLIGYGKLIIIKHNDVFLSAYAHNDNLLVEEGAMVAGGQQIAEMGSSGTREIMLHFEIRRNGKPVAPLQYLPRS